MIVGNYKVFFPFDILVRNLKTYKPVNTHKPWIFQCVLPVIAIKAGFNCQ